MRMRMRIHTAQEFKLQHPSPKRPRFESPKLTLTPYRAVGAGFEIARAEPQDPVIRVG